jgi:PAS domain S-box-containing protein
MSPKVDKIEIPKKKKIIVVDNHPVMLDYTARFLLKKGHQVVTAVDGLTALNILKDFVPDVMFIDLIMPNIGGEKLCRIIRSSPRLTKVFLVVISAVAAEEEIDIAEIGADACIAKGPFDKMNRHILQVLNRLDKKEASSLRKKVLGLGEIHARNITKELLSAKKHFERILDHITEGVMELNLEGKIVYVNPAAATLAGAMEEDLLSKDFTALFGKNEGKRAARLLAEMQSYLQPIVKNGPFRMNRKKVCLKIFPMKADDDRSIIVILNEAAEIA